MFKDTNRLDLEHTPISDTCFMIVNKGTLTALKDLFTHPTARLKSFISRKL